jgi:DNA-binding NtrC family response regulator
MKLHGIMLQNELLRQITAENLSYEERVLARCRLAKELEDAGNYEAAVGALSSLWQGVGKRPELKGLGEYAAAELLLRAGTLTGWIGSIKEIQAAQEKAKDLISESVIILERLQDVEKVAEALADLGHCYWRQGALDEARATLHTALEKLADSDTDLKGLVLTRSAIVEDTATRHQDALNFLNEAWPLIQTSLSHALKGKYHMTRAIVLKNLSGDDEYKIVDGGETYIDHALVEQYAAAFHLEQAGHKRYQAGVENNLGYTLVKVGKFSEAHEHLNRARILYGNLGNTSTVGLVDDTRARAFLGEGHDPEAVKAAQSAVRVLEKTDLNGQLAQALTTYGVALARTGKYKQARTAFERAVKTAELAGDVEGAGLAYLSAIEELGAYLSRQALLDAFHMADFLLKNSQRPKILARLLSAARVVLTFSQNQSSDFNASSFIYAAEETKKLLEMAQTIARANAATLITGETGTGKEVLSRLIHQWSGRTGHFVVINCAAIPETLIESELFGYRKGAFTGAVEDYSGAVAKAAGGTLFLDEIAELSTGAQATILRLIETGEIHPIGEPTPSLIDVRIIAATNRGLRERINERKFREDLFYRLETFHIEIPPLRERPDDIPALAAHFIAEACAKHGKQVTFSKESLEAMRQLPLKGNARELRTLIERTILVSSEGGTIRKEDIEIVAARHSDAANFADVWAGCSLKKEVHRFEADLISLALRKAEGSITKAARLLDISYPTLQDMLVKRHKALLDQRTPVIARRRSIMNKGI